MYRNDAGARTLENLFHTELLGRVPPKTERSILLFFGISNNVAFKLVPKGKHSKFIPLYTFCSNTCEDGLDPSDVAMDESGNLFGTAYLGGNEWDGGTVWELSGTNLQVLHTFCEGGNTCKDGKSPMGGLLRDGAGNLFGTTTQFGEHGAGNVFELSP